MVAVRRGGGRAIGADVHHEMWGIDCKVVAAPQKPGRVWAEKKALPRPPRNFCAIFVHSSSGEPDLRVTSSVSSEAARFRLFALFWGGQTILEMGKWGEMLASSQQFLVFSLACLVCLRPGLPLRLLCLAVVQVLVALTKMPWLTNHTIVNTVANLTLVASLLPVLRGRTGGPAWSHFGALVSGNEDFREQFGTDWIRYFAPLLRTELLLVYGWATFHKLNSDWFDPEQSCAVIFWNRMVGFTPWTQGLGVLGFCMPYVALGIEILLPVLLARRRWRMAGILSGLCFHLMLGLVGFYRFSAIVTALYCLFLPDWVVVAVDEQWAAWQLRWGQLPRWLVYCVSLPARRVYSALTGVAAFLVLIRFPMSFPQPPLVLVREQILAQRAGWSLLFQILWLAATAGVFAMLLVVVRRYRFHTDRPQRVRVPGWLWIFPILTMLNGASPYLGIKTEASFSMFSNLRTAGTQSNHLLIRVPMALVSEGTDFVEISETTDGELQRVRDSNYQLAWMELCSYAEARIQRGEDFGLILRRQGIVSEYLSVKQARDQFRHQRWLVRTLTWFRPVNMDPICPCMH